MKGNLTLVQQLRRPKFLAVFVSVLSFCETISVMQMPAPTSSPTLSQSKKGGKKCFRATNYYLPDQDQDARFKGCKKTQKVKIGKNKIAVCPDFLADVKLQGSGHFTYKGKKHVLTYSGRMEQVKGKCSTTVGAANKCLTAFVHIAADPRYFNMGDIVEVPELRYMRLPRPDGKGDFIHPGYFIVADTGGAIKGPNRFDFFVGKMFPLTKENPFGPWQKKMTDENHCIMNFKRISRKANPSKAQRMARAVMASVSAGETLVASAQSAK